MKIINILFTCSVLLFSSTCFATVIAKDAYDIKMLIDVPRVYDNTQSLGYRKYQRQTIRGIMYLEYDTEYNQPIITFGILTNKTHKVSGKYVTYNVEVTDFIYPRVNYIGDNYTNIFKVPTTCFFINAFPSYAIVEEPGDDNSLNIMLAAKGTSYYNSKCNVRMIKSFNGYISGTLGCGCMAYGHKSPTRVAGACGPKLDCVDDVSAVFGRWTAKYNKKLSK